jgi:hypothetical protein
MTTLPKKTVGYCGGFITAGMATSLLLVSQSASARVRFEPKLGVRQVFSDNVAAAASSGKDAGMLTVVQPGFGLTVDGGRTQATLDYRLEFRQPIFAKSQQDKVRHNLVARGEMEVINDLFWITGGSVITQVFKDRQGAVSLNPDSLSNNLDNVASSYIEPTVRTRINDFANFGAGFRYTLTAVKDRPDNKLLLNDLGQNFSAENFSFQPTSDSDAQNGYVQFDAGDYFQNFKWTVRGSWEREKRKFLNELYTSKSGVADIEIPLNRAIAVLGSAGWEQSQDIQDVIITECDGRPRLVDPATGALTRNGTIGVLAIDRSYNARNGIAVTGETYFPTVCGTPTQRTGVNFKRKGFVWDAGIHLSPGRKMDLVVRGGGRFGDVNINATGSYKFSEKSVMDVSYTTSLDSLGRLLSNSVAGLPTQYRSLSGNVRPTLATQNGTDPLTGRVFTGTLAINSATYLSRIAQVRFRHERGPWSGTVAVVRESRQLQSVQQLIGQQIVDVNTLPNDVTTGGNFTIDRKLSRKRSVFFEGSVQNSDFALNGNRSDWLYGGAAGYRVEFTPKIRGEARYLFSRRTSNVPGSNITENAVSLGLEATF